MRQYPTWATSKGDKRYDSLFTDYSADGRAKRLTEYRNYLNRLKTVDRKALNETDLVSADMFEIALTRKLNEAKFKVHTMPIDQQSGPQLSLPNLISSITFVQRQDYLNYHLRLLAFPKLIEQTISNMREGMELGLVSSKTNIEPVITQIDKFLVDDPTTSVFYSPIVDNIAGIASAEIADLGTMYAEAISASVLPAYRLLQKFLAEEYLPVCREEFGVWSLPDGKKRYQYLIERHTTLQLTPDEITKMGMDELARIEVEMEKIMKQVGFAGTRAEFFEHLHTDPQFYYTDEDSLIAGYTEILAGITARVPEIFGILPQAPCVVKELEEYRSATAPTAYYNGPADDGSRPGVFWANTYNLAARPKYEMEALTYHEGIPGHHLQIAISQERNNLPKFRQNSWFTAFGEGWALYSERLPKELGFYQDPYSDFGRLIYDAWRASRLVVDCGLHYYKWERDEAIKFMKEHVGLTDENVVSEIDRYIAWPGQALGYKIGQMKILELRARAETALGEKFSLSEFHDQVLNEGNLPLPALEKKIDEWIASKSGAGA